MARRNLLHVDKLDDFKAFLTWAGYAYRDGRGYFQVLQIRVERLWSRGFVWHSIFRKLPREGAQHYTVPEPLIPLVQSYIDHRNREKLCHK